MSLRLLLDEDSQAKLLISQLWAVGHDVLTVTEAGLEARSDAEVLAYAASVQRVVLTRNCDDYYALHSAGQTHTGILSVYLNRDPRKDLSYADIVRAIANLETHAVQSGWELAGQFVALNAWNY
jgi:hypothetical protein